jgi:hypothetical protein
MRELQRRADDLAECLLICELELYTAANLEKRLEAFDGFCTIVMRIENLLRDAERENCGGILRSLDKKTASILCSEAYKRAAWFAIEAPKLCWMVCPVTLGPAGQLQPC